MQEESRWREALGQQIASHARGYADLDLAVFWAGPPTAKERRDIVTRALERDWHLWPSF